MNLASKLMAKSSTERGRELRARNKALGRKRADIPMTDAEKVEVKKLLKTMRETNETN